MYFYNSYTYTLHTHTLHSYTYKHIHIYVHYTHTHTYTYRGVASLVPLLHHYGELSFRGMCDYVYDIRCDCDCV